MADIIGTEGADTLTGTAGDDFIDGLGGDDTINGVGGNNRLEGGEGNDTIVGGDGQDLIYGEGGNDIIRDLSGGYGLIIAGAGNDIIEFANGRGVIYADDFDYEFTPQDGNDTISVTNGFAGTYITTGGGNDTINAAGTGQIIFNAGVGDDAVTITGFNSGSAYLGSGNDSLNIPGGFFGVDLGTGRDTVAITAVYPGYMTVGSFSAGEEGDRLDLSLFGSDPFGTGTLVLSSSDGDAIIDHPSSGMQIRLTGVIAANLSAYNLGVPNPGYAPQGFTLEDTSSSPTNAAELVGADGNDVLRGFGGNDLLFGAAGNDRLEGGDGDDVLAGGRGEDQLIGGAGVDTATYAGNFGGVFVNLTLGRGYTNFAFGDTYDSIENVIGSSYGDFLIGDAGVNRLDGGAGNDTIIGAVGADVLIGGDGVDLLSFEDNSGTVFVNLLTGQGYNNAAHGDTFSGFENVVGGLFDDTLIGDHGANRLDGAMGADTLVGNGGADTFVFSYAPGATSIWGSPNADTIFDFASGEDKLEINSGAFGGGLTPGALAADQFVVGSAAADANDRFIYDQAHGMLYFDADGSGAGTQVLMAVMPNHDAIAATDFAIV